MKSEGDPERGEEEVRGRGRQNWREGEREGEEDRPRTGVVAHSRAHKRWSWGKELCISWHLRNKCFSLRVTKGTRMLSSERLTQDFRADGVAEGA